MPSYFVPSSTFSALSDPARLARSLASGKRYGKPWNAPSFMGTGTAATGFALMACVHFNLLESLALLLAHGADVAQEDSDGWTALHGAAALGGRMEAMATLLAHGAPVDAVDRLGRSPLAMAAWNGRLDCVQALLEAGADPWLAALSGSTPIDAAAEGSEPSACAALFKHAIERAQLDAELPRLAPSQGNPLRV